MMDFRRLALVGFLLWATAASAKLPVRNMTVELRVVAQADAAGPVAGIASASVGSVVRTQPVAERDLEIQKVFVMNGERAQVKLNRSMPLQWVKTAATRTSSATSATGDTASTEGKGVENATTWLDAGQGLAVQVRWPGGKQPAVVEVEVDTTTAEAQGGYPAPAQSRSRFASTVAVPLGEWFTIAVTGPKAVPEQSGVYSTRAVEADAAKLVQLRVLAP